MPGHPAPSAFVQAVRDTLQTLGEDPDEFARLLDRLVLDQRSGTAREMLLVEDLALIEWERRRVEQARQ